MTVGIVAAALVGTLGAVWADEVTEADRRAALAQINAARAAGAICPSGTEFGAAGPLRWDDRLARAAQAYADTLAAHPGHVSHTGPHGSSMDDRVQAAGWCWAANENLAWYPLYARHMPDYAWAQLWASSLGHCRTQHHPQWTHGAIGIAGHPEPQYLISTTTGDTLASREATRWIGVLLVGHQDFVVARGTCLDDDEVIDATFTLPWTWGRVKGEAHTPRRR